jgi:hypothetical protein
MRFLSQFSIDNSASDPQHCAETGFSADAASIGDEESLLETIRGLQAELRLARAAAQVDRTDPVATWTGTEVRQFDVIEPEDDLPAPVDQGLPQLDTVENTATAPEKTPAEMPRTDEAVPEPTARYSRLFTRIRQRRRAARERLDRDDII